MNKHLIESLNKLMTAHCSEDNKSHDNRYYTKKTLTNCLKHTNPHGII